jgi:hypothetical protein
MNRAAVSILLQYEDAWSSHKMRIVLDDDCHRNAGNHVSDEYIISGKLVIAMR